MPPDRKKKEFFPPNRNAAINHTVVIGDLFKNDRAKIESLFETTPWPGSIEALAASIAGAPEPQKPLFVYLNHGAKYQPGLPSPELASRSFDFFEKAAALWKALPSASLITLPVSKELIMESGIDFQGHTEELFELYGQKGFMCMYHPKMPVIPLTNHIALKRVPAAMKKIDTEVLYRSLLFFRELFKPKLPFAMTGVNPHAGEGGRIGTEESDLNEVLIKLATRGQVVEGPFPADGLFTRANRNKYGLFITAYHDQGLIPFKALIGTAGVNTTLNLPRLRVSPDHGPAYDFAGKDTADIQSVLKSMQFAMTWGKKWITQYKSLF